MGADSEKIQNVLKKNELPARLGKIMENYFA